VNFEGVNYPQLTQGAFHQRLSKMHSTTQIPFIWTNEQVYSYSPPGNLDKTRVGETLRCPLQERFYSDSQRGFSITVHNHTTLLTPIQGIVSRIVSAIHCTAVWTPLRSVVSINFLKRNSVFKTVTLKKISELCVRNSVNLLSSILSNFTFCSPKPEFFNGDRSIIFKSKIHNHLSNLPASCLNKVSLFAFKSSKVFLGLFRAFISMMLEFTSSLLILSLPNSYISAKVKLFNHLRCLAVENRYSSKSSRTNINPHNIPSIVNWFRVFLFNRNSNLAVKQTNRFGFPPTLKEIFESIVSIITLDRNYKALARRISYSKARCASFSFKELKPSFVKSDGASLKSFLNSLSFSPNILTGFLNNVRWKEGGFAYV